MRIENDLRIGDRVYVRKFDFVGTVCGIHENTFVSVIPDGATECNDNSPYYITTVEKLDGKEEVS